VVFQEARSALALPSICYGWHHYQLVVHCAYRTCHKDDVCHARDSGKKLSISSLPHIQTVPLPRVSLKKDRCFRTIHWYQPRRKNIVLVTKSSAYIIWKNAVMEPGSLKPKSKKNYWLRVLKKLGEEVDILEFPMIDTNKNSLRFLRC
jgi:hypothetical protein